MLKASFEPYNLTFKQPAGTSRGILKHKNGWYISIWEESLPQTKGIGECSILPGLSPDERPGLEAKIHEVCAHIHTLAFDFQRTLHSWPAIRFAIETALLDLQTGGQKLLFSSSFTRGETGIPINGLIWMGDAEEMSRRIEKKLNEGFTCLKMKIGAIDFEQEYRLLTQLRQRFSPNDLEIRVDANGAFSPREAPAILDRLSQLNLHSIEQPIKAGQWNAMAQLCASSPVPIALDEELIGINEPQQKALLLDTIRPSYLIIKPSLTGGFFASREWIDLAEARGTQWWITSALESNIGLSAIAQWTATLQSPRPQGLGTGELFIHNIDTPLTIQDGALWYKQKPQFKRYRRLTISGISYQSDQLKHLVSEKLAQSELPTWERSLFTFLEEWLNDKKYVEIKTSGSTGAPKCIKASKDAMLQSAFHTLSFFNLQPGQSALLCLPCQYVAGMMMVVRALAGGLNLIPVPVSGHPLETVSEPIDFAALTPFQMSNEMDSDAPKRAFLRTVILGGAPVGNDLQQQLESQKFNVWETYGMTETLSHIALRPVNGPETSPWFTPLKNVSVSTDQRGCLIIEAPDITKQRLITNDLATINNRGHFQIKGRIDHIVNTGGIKVCPEEVERKIAHLLTGAFAIVAEKHTTLGQQLVLMVEQPVSEPRKLLRQMKKRLPAYHAPRRIMVVNPLPRTQTGKIKRQLPA